MQGANQNKSKKWKNSAKNRQTVGYKKDLGYVIIGLHTCLRCRAAQRREDSARWRA